MYYKKSSFYFTDNEHISLKLNNTFNQ